VRPLNPLVNGEGSMAMAPNGDVIGMTWDAYSGDHFVAYKYDAVSAKWFTLDNAVHQPFYDRPSSPVRSRSGSAPTPCPTPRSSRVVPGSRNRCSRAQTG
jgi:hypothetical protein